MTTTVEIPDDLYQQAAARADRDRIPVGDLIAHGLRLALGDAPPPNRNRITFPLVHSARPGVLTLEAVRAAEDAAAQQEDVNRAGAV